MSLTITPKHMDDYEIHVKRLHLPYLLESPCPVCSKVIQRDLSSGPYTLSYPKLGRTACWFVCEDCNREWTEDFILSLTVEKP